MEDVIDELDAEESAAVEEGAALMMEGEGGNGKSEVKVPDGRGEKWGVVGEKGKAGERWMRSQEKLWWLPRRRKMWARSRRSWASSDGRHEEI